MIDGNTFLVTGGGSGLGASVGRALLKRGANVVFAEIDVKGAEAEAAVTPNTPDHVRVPPNSPHSSNTLLRTHLLTAK